MTTYTITTADIRDLEVEAADAGDTLQALLCRLATGREVLDAWSQGVLADAGYSVDDDTASARAVAECERVIRAARAQV